MTKRINISSGTKWEESVGYSRVVKVGNQVFVTGTTSVDEDGNIVGVGDVYKQTEYIISKIEKYLNEAGAKLENVVRTRMFVVNIADWKEIGKVHHKFFKNIKPATTMVEVNGLIEPDLLIEIEADAVIIE
jgi:enamine deaminase RidA (YjgF/YER057c/UK114 family)